MRYYAMRKMKVNGKELNFANEVKEFEELPQRNQQSMLDMGWVKAVADSENEPVPRKPKTRKKMNTSKQKKTTNSQTKKKEMKQDQDEKSETVSNLDK